MEKEKKDDFSLALSNDEHFAAWYVLAVMFVFGSIIKNDDFKAKCLESYNKAIAERKEVA